MNKFRVEQGNITLPVSELNKLNDLALELKEKEIELKNREAKLESEYQVKAKKLDDKEIEINSLIKDSSSIICYDNIDVCECGEIEHFYTFEVIDNEIREEIEDKAETNARSQLLVLAKDLGVFQLRKFLKSIEIV